MVDIEIEIGSDPEFVITCGDTPEPALEVLRCLYPEYIEKIEPDEDIIQDRIDEIYDEQRKELIDDRLRGMDYEDWLELDADIVSREVVNQIYNRIVFIEKNNDNPEEVIKDEKWNGFMLEFLEEMKENDYLLDEAEPEKIITDSKEFDYYITDIIDEFTDNYEHNETFGSISDSAIIDLLGYHLNLKPETEENIIQELTDKYEDYEDMQDLPDILSDPIYEGIRENLDEDDFSLDTAKDYFCSPRTKIGCDGDDALGELRPDEKEEPLQHYHEIAYLIKELNNLIEQEDPCTRLSYMKAEPRLLAGGIQGMFGSFHQIGGHIHIGYTYQLEDFVLNNCNNFVKTFIKIAKEKGIIETEHIHSQLGHTREIVLEENEDTIRKIMASSLSIYSGIPLALIESEADRHTRHSKGSQGQLFANDYKGYGIEWRMPSSWLVSPFYTMASLTLSYVVAYEVVNNIANLFETLDMHPEEDKIYHLFLNNEVSLKNTLTKFMASDNLSYLIDGMQNSISSSVQQHEWEKIRKNHIPYIYEDIQSFVLYENNETYREIIDELFDTIKKGEIWEKDENILPKWLEVIKNADI